MKERHEIEEKYKWDLSKYCKNDEDFYAKLEKANHKLEQLKKFEGKLADDKVLFEYLEFTSNLEEELFFTDYAYFKRCENNADRKYNEMNERLSTFFTKPLYFFCTSNSNRLVFHFALLYLLVDKAELNLICQLRG